MRRSLFFLCRLNALDARLLAMLIVAVRPSLSLSLANILIQDCCHYRE